MFFPLTIKNKKEERGGRSGHMTVKNKIWCFLSSYLAHPDINSQKLWYMQNQMLIIYSMCMIELSGNLRKHTEVMPATICGPNIHLVSSQVALSRKSHSQRMCFSHLCSACPYWWKKPGIFISDASSCVTITATCFSVKTT